MLGAEPDFYRLWRDGGVTAAAPTIAVNASARETVAQVGRWLRYIDAHSDELLLVERAKDLYRAKREGKLGIIFHFQNSLPVERDLNLLTVYHRLGVRMIQLAYNEKNFVGDGAEERTDAGLSRFGIALIREMNRLGIIVDLSHTGVRTTLEAIEVSEAPPIFSHANVRAVHDSMRNLTDEQIKAVAAAGGVIGVVGYPGFVSSSPRPTVADLLKHVRYIVDLVGVDHVGIGIDYFEKMAGVCSDEEALRWYEDAVASGQWSRATYPPPPWYYPEEISDPSKLSNLLDALLNDGYTPEEVRKIVGGNFLRVCRQVWGE